MDSQLGTIPLDWGRLILPSSFITFLACDFNQQSLPYWHLLSSPSLIVITITIGEENLLVGFST